jgi:predicted phage terminase large subunit-like protein
MKLTADLIEAFSGTFLSPRYDSPQPTPDFHRAGWALYCSDAPQAGLAAPRNHAKSTSFTHDFTLADVLFRQDDYAIIVGSSEEMAIEHLQDISAELHENEDLIREFKIARFITDQKTDIIVECADGHKFRIIARGAEQKIRGRKWNGKRPGLIVCDDMEDDEQVESKDRRRKFSRWFFRAAKQALRDGGRIRVHGTILHEDSLLSRLTRNSTWKFIVYRAHAGFDDFSNILWPEKFSADRLKNIRQEFIDNQDAAGYSQEYLNDPFDNDDVYLRGEDFLPMEDEDYQIPKTIYAAADFAISIADSANRTSFSIGGIDTRNLLHFLDQRVGRWDQLAIIDEMFSIQLAHRPEVIFVEGGVIWRGISATIYNEMQLRGIFINIMVINPVKDKAVRGRPLQKRMRAGGCRFNKETEWYPGFETELRRFTGYGQATLDDQFDSAALLAKGIELVSIPEQEDFFTEEEEEFERGAKRVKHLGRSAVTGY